MEKNNNNVIGPLTRADWIFLKMLKGNLLFYKSKGAHLYQSAIEKERKLYKETLYKDAS